MKDVATRRTASPEVVSATYGVPVGSLANLRYKKQGPRYFKRGRRILYLVEDVEKWLLSNPVQTIDSIKER